MYPNNIQQENCRRAKHSNNIHLLLLSFFVCIMLNSTSTFCETRRLVVLRFHWQYCPRSSLLPREINIKTSWLKATRCSFAARRLLRILFDAPTTNANKNSLTHQDWFNRPWWHPLADGFRSTCVSLFYYPNPNTWTDLTLDRNTPEVRSAWSNSQR